MFVWNSNELNSDQETAIVKENNVLLIACPGSGKTRALTYKIALELSKLTSSKKFIIAITYTNRAAEEIKDRVELLGVDISQLWIGTIHSFCLEWILRPYHLYSENLKIGFRVINSQETQDLLTELCAPYSAQKVTHFDCSYIITSAGYKLTSNQDWKHSTVDKILKEYWKVLTERKQIDFELILYYSFQLLKENKFISEVLAKIFLYFLIDEYQDTREIQYQIFSKIFKASNNSIKSFIVGDPNQAIYTSLGGYAISKTELESMTGGIFEELSLSGNYRSSDIVIDYFDYFKTFPNSIIGCGENKSYESIISFNNEISRAHLEDEIVRLILYNINVKQISPNEICIVGPQWVHLASLTRNLMIKLPDYSFNGPGMAPFAKDIDNFFYKLCRIVLTEPAPNMYLTRLRWSSEILSELNHLGIDVSHVNKKKLLMYCNLINLKEEDGVKYLRSFFDTLFAKIEIDFAEYSSLKEHYSSFFKSSEDRIAKLVKEGYDYISTTENFKKVFKQRDGITISTIHGVKGAEFNTVIAFALLQDYVPHFSDKNGEDSAKKLLYVISSRAKKNLHLISEKGRFRSWGNPPAEYTPTEQLAIYNYDYDPL